ncbi:lysine-specific demethylase JMJ17 isoform X2 [Lactuca sativa]|uniref:lysine-specific demethylase JMJ17 isoform X2 n=1 Tax=Lactuca sativa TaxID=4236 RepID=UPI001C68CBD8|nr:lysine-specific demethylase JMJ17 isoform X2 [Lactuca sativa]
MGKSRPRAAEKRVLGQGSIVLTSGSSLAIPPAPVYTPTEEEFKDPLAYIYKIRPEAESYGICKIIPPKNWKPPFALDLDKFSFPTKTQAIHQLQARPPACNSKTFELEYNRFLEEQCGKKAVKKKVVFEGKELDLCKLFNGVKRFGGYDNVVKEKKWGEVFRFVRSGGKISACSKYVLCQLYKEHLYDYENYYSKLDRVKEKSCKRGVQGEKKSGQQSCKRSRINEAGDNIKLQHKGKDEEYDQICEQCRSGLHAEVMLLCDRCNKGWHIHCLSPPLARVPPGNWYCSECFNSEKDSFGFVPGKQLTLEAFRRVADRAKKKWFGSTSASRVQLEKKFWEIVEGSVGEVEVIYGSDLDTSVYGSGFPRAADERPSSIELNEWDEYSDSPWNLNNLPKLQGSMLRAVHHNIAGVMVPWLYIGMLFSSFCWHFEDHCFYSMNYHHWGEPKCWYSVPGSEASAFEKVMRNSLPDLFDAQPDLLFQLVTMLNPSVLQENNVPVYSVLQEPGNFVITFPRSYHGGFNFGLNCAEAVNFAPADWLPYGGFGAELYQHYRKPAVLSHEELLCVVAKNDFDSNAIPYLKKELLRVYNKEKSWRERLWKNGIISSSFMAPHEQPNFVGVEEDATCVICQQFLYLSAVGCSCRPSALVCLEHWENLCECKPRKRHLLYRHTLSELNDLVIMMEKDTSEETTQKRNTRKLSTCTKDSPSLSKKAQLAEEWLVRSCKILQMPYSSDAYASALKEAEQFLWAGSEMDPVRELAKNLAEAQNWAEGVRDCLSKIELWTRRDDCKVERVKMEYVSSLLDVSPVPCNEPGHLKLKGHEEEARVLIQEIYAALSTSSNVSIVDLETLYSKASKSAIYVKESEDLSTKLSAVKLCLQTVRNCISEKTPDVIEVDVLNNLKSEIVELKLQVPEVSMFLDFAKRVELCQSRCTEMLKGSITLKNLEVLVQEYDGFTVNVPELKLLRQYQSDALYWISRFNNILKNAHEREDQENVFDELICLEKDGSLLKVQVDELLLVDVELKKACCRVKAWKVLRSKMPLESIQQVMDVATELQIGNEKVFKEVSDVLARAVCLEEKAKHVLACEVHMSEYEDVLRMSENLCALVPSIDGVKGALLVAKSWLIKSKPYLVSDLSVMSDADSLLKVDDLKELVLKSKLLKMCLEERSLLEDVLRNYIKWEHHACSALHDAESLLNILDVNLSYDIVFKLGDQITKMESIMKAEYSLRFDSVVIPKLQETCAILQWCFIALNFHAVDPTLKEVLMLLEDAEKHHVAYASRPFWRSLVDGMNWLKKALEILGPCNDNKRFDLSDVKETLRQYKMIKISFSLILDRLLDAVKRHNVWVEEVKSFFNRSSGDRSWSLLLQLEGVGSTDAFSCTEMEMVASQVQKVKEWKQRGRDIVGVKAGDDNLLLNALSQILDSLDRSLEVYNKKDGCNQRRFCMFCSCESGDQELSTCSVCMECYHMQCIKPSLGGGTTQSHASAHMCPHCHIIESGKISQLKIDAKRPELDMFVKLLSDADNLCVEIEEKVLIGQIVEKAVAYKDCLTKIVEFSLASLGNDPSLVFSKLSTALKAVEVAGVYDGESNSKFEFALARNSWRVRASKLLQPSSSSSQKPSIHQIRRLLKEGVAIKVPLEDNLWKRLTEIKEIGLQWALKAKEVSADSGALELHKVFELIDKGENLAVHFDNELKLLRERSMLYCICRKPYDRIPMICCDKCEEWYHFKCIKLSWVPKDYICPACKIDLLDEIEIDDNRCTSSSIIQQDRSNVKLKCEEEPQTPSPRPVELRREAESKDISSRRRSGIERLLWRNKKPFRRSAKKRIQLDIFSSFFHVHS